MPALRPVTTWLLSLLAAVILCMLAAGAQAAFTPWDALTNDSWIFFGAPQTRISMHTVNAGPYEVGFDQATSTNSARGENALRFSFGGVTTGHLVSTQTSGSFGVANVGNSRTFRDLLILVTIDAPSVGPSFSLTLSTGGSSYTFSPSADFGFYSHPEYSTGRPSGYYSATNPSGEGLTYDFANGMVSVYAAQNVNLAPGGTVNFDYQFANLPGEAVFSVYGYDASIGWIYHTNRSVPDANALKNPISTFAVVPEPGILVLLWTGLAWVRKRRCNKG